MPETMVLPLLYGWYYCPSCRRKVACQSDDPADRGICEFCKTADVAELTAQVEAKDRELLQLRNELQEARLRSQGEELDAADQRIEQKDAELANMRDRLAAAETAAAPPEQPAAEF